VLASIDIFEVALRARHLGVMGLGGTDDATDEKGPCDR